MNVRAADHGEASAVLAPGTLLGGRWRIGDLLGQGGSGAVYVAVDASIGGAPPIALKVIHRHLLRDRQINGRFHREAKLLGKLEGPHLVRLLDFGEDETGLLYMALELSDGLALDQLLASGAHIPPERAARMVVQICAALEVAHASGVVHRDLKPGNVLVSGDDDFVRVLDFGMAKVIHGDVHDSITALTEQNMVFGTPQYMAPEQARGDDVDHRADIYAAGVILYELLTGGAPFDAATPIGVMTAHLVEEPEPPCRRAPTAGIPPALEAVVLHALAKQPKDRYPSARALADAVERALRAPTDVRSAAPPADDLETSDTDLDLGPPAPGERLSLALGVDPARGPWMIAGVVAALVATAAGVAFSLLSGG